MSASTFTSSKQRAGWFLPFAFLTGTFFLYLTIGLSATKWMHQSRYSRPPNFLDEFLSEKTVDALYGDDRLHNAIFDLTDAFAQASVNLGEKLNSDGLKELGENLTEELRKIRSVDVSDTKSLELSLGKRGLFSDLEAAATKLIGGGAGNSTGGIIQKLGSSILSGLGGAANGIAGSLAGPALFLGIGIGMGADTGLNLSDANFAKTQAAKIAASYGQKPEGINLVVQNLATGLTGQVAPAIKMASNGVNISAVIKTLPIGMASFGLAQGIGQGAAMGLNLTDKKTMPSNTSGIVDIVTNFGLGVSQSITGGIDVNKLAAMAAAGGGQIKGQIPQIAAAAGTGLAMGAASGLGINKGGNATLSSLIGRRQAAARAPAAPATPGGFDINSIDITGTVGNFTMGLSQTFLKQIDIPRLAKSVNVSSFGGGVSLDAKSVVSLASGAGMGIGGGLALGLGITNGGLKRVLNSTAPEGSMEATIEQTAEQFLEGTIGGFLQNGGTDFVVKTVKELAQNPPKIPFKVNLVQAAEGAARGMVEGAVNAISQGGGISSVLAGNFSDNLLFDMKSLPVSQFDDSINGSVISFMRGLSGSGVLLGAKLFRSGKIDLGALGTGLQNGANKAIASPSKSVVSYNPLTRRQETSPPPPVTSLAIDSNTIQGVAQLGANVLTCEGIGGLAALGLGVATGPALKGADFTKLSSMFGTSLDPSVLQQLPKEPITILSDGNTFVISFQDILGVQINGLTLKPFIAFTALHIVLCTFAFLYALPVYAALGAIQGIAILIGHPFNQRKMTMWRSVFLAMFTFSAIAGTISGFLGLGNAKHFSTPHAIFGLIAFLITFPTTLLSAIRLRTDAPPPPHSAFVFSIRGFMSALSGSHMIHTLAAVAVQIAIFLGPLLFSSGFSLLRSISVCAIDAIFASAIMAGLTSFVSMVTLSSTGMVLVRQWLEARIDSRGNLLAKNGSNMLEKAEGSGSVDTPGPSRRAKPERPPRPDTIQSFGFGYKGKGAA